MNFKTLVSHAFVFVYMPEFDNYILFGACRNVGNHCETTKIIIKRTFGNPTYTTYSIVQ